MGVEQVETSMWETTGGRTGAEKGGGGEGIGMVRGSVEHRGKRERQTLNFFYNDG